MMHSRRNRPSRLDCACDNKWRGDFWEVACIASAGLERNCTLQWRSIQTMFTAKPARYKDPDGHSRHYRGREQTTKKNKVFGLF